MHAGNTFRNRNIELEATSSGNAFASVTGPFVRIQQIMSACERNYHRAVKELQRAVNATDAQPDADVRDTSTSSASFRQNSQAPTPAISEPSLAGSEPAPSAAQDRGPKLPEAA